MHDSFAHGVPRSVACALALASIVGSSRAGENQYDASVPVTPLPWNQTVTLPAFDPSLGVLRDVQITVTGLVHGTWGLENTGAQTIHDLSGEFLVAYVSVTLPASGFPTLNPAMEGDTTTTLGPYDGVTDYAGTSGITVTFSNSAGTGLPSYTQEVFATPTLQSYVAAAPGQTIAITLDAVDMSSAPSPPLVEQYSLQASAIIHVVYGYDPHPTGICRSNPWTGCPCGNLGWRGCGNSVNGLGGALDSSGQASVSNDTLVLAGSGMTNGTALYIQGDGHAYGGVLYGDGIRCAVGQIRRLGAKANSGGASRYPQRGDASVSVRGLIPGPGVTRYYQTIYRDPPSFCTSATVNITDGVAIRWGP